MKPTSTAKHAKVLVNNVTTVRLSDDDRATYKKLGGIKWLRATLAAKRKAETKKA